MNSVRAKFCGGVFGIKVKGSFLNLLVANRPCKITQFILPLIILRAYLLWIIKTSMYIFISPNKQKYLCGEGAAAAAAGWPYDYILCVCVCVCVEF